MPDHADGKSEMRAENPADNGEPDQSSSESPGTSESSTAGPCSEICQNDDESPRKSSRHVEAMDQAVEAVRENKMSMRCAALMFGVPKSTLQNRLNHHHTKSIGGQRKFNDDQEAVLVDIMNQCFKLGFPLDRKDLVKVLVTLGKAKGVPFKKFSGRWYRAFLQRTKDASSRVLQKSNSRLEKKWDSKKCERWIADLEHLRWLGYLENPAGVWTFSESEFILAELYQKKNSLAGADNPDVDQVSLFVCGNAAGYIASPFFSYDGEDQLVHDAQSIAQLCWTSTNQCGILDDDVFTDYFKQEVLPLMANSDKNVIFLDESLYASNPRFIQALFESGRDIRVLCYPYNQSRRLQPLDKAACKIIRKRWRDYISHLEEAEAKREKFPEHILTLWPQLSLGETVLSGLRDTGLWPLVPDTIRSTIPAPLDPNRPIKRSRKQRREETVMRESLARMGMDKKKIRSVLSGIRKIANLEATAAGASNKSPAKILVEKVCPPKRKRTKTKTADPTGDPTGDPNGAMQASSETEIAACFVSGLLEF